MKSKWEARSPLGSTAGCSERNHRSRGGFHGETPGLASLRGCHGPREDIEGAGGEERQQEREEKHEFQLCSSWDD